MLKITILIINDPEDKFARANTVISLPGHLEYEALCEYVLNWENGARTEFREQLLKEGESPEELDQDEDLDLITSIDDFDDKYNWAYEHLLLDPTTGSSVTEN